VLRQAQNSKYDLQKDPLFSSTLHGMQLNTYLSMKKKARIIVPDSATLIGVVDSDGILEADEVFI
jgi:hypothetical protein